MLSVRKITNIFQESGIKKLKIKRTAFLVGLAAACNIAPLKKDTFEKHKIQNEDIVSKQLSSLLGKKYNDDTDNRIADIKQLWSSEFSDVDVSLVIKKLKLDENQKINFLHALTSPITNSSDNKQISKNCLISRLNLAQNIDALLSPDNKDDISNIVSKLNFEYQNERTNFAIEKLKSTNNFDNQEIINFLKKLRTLEYPHLRANIISEMLNYDYLSKEKAVSMTFLPVGSQELEDFRKTASLLNDIEEIKPLQKQKILNDRQISSDVLGKNKFVLADIGKDNLEKFSDTDIDLSIKFANYLNKLSPDEMSQNKRKDLVKLLVANNSEIFEASELFHKYFPVLPKNVKEYCNIIPSLVSLSGVSKKSLTARENEDFKKGVTDLENILKKYNISDYEISFKNDDAAGPKISLKNNKEMEKSLNKIYSYLPELSAMSEKDTKKMLLLLQNVIKSNGYRKLKNHDKDILSTAVLLSNIDKKDSKNNAYSSFYIAKRFNYSNEDLTKIFRLVEQQNVLKHILKSENPIEDLRFSAFRLKEDNLLDMAFILSKSKISKNSNDKIIQEIRRTLKSYVNNIKKYDFILPQVSENDLFAKSKKQQVNGYNVNVVNSKDIKNFYAFLHSPEKIENTSNTRNLKIYTLDAFNVLDDNNVLCTSYVSSDKIGSLADFGVVMKVGAGNIYAAAGYDMESPYRMKTENLVKYYMFDTGRMENTSREKTYDHRKFISEQLRKIMHISEDKYVKRFSKIKNCTTLEEIGNIDPEFKRAYEKLLSVTCKNMLGDNKEKIGFMRDGDHWNETLVANPKIQAVYTMNLEKTPKEYLELASKYNLPVVILNKKH